MMPTLRAPVSSFSLRCCVVAVSRWISVCVCVDVAHDGNDLPHVADFQGKTEIQ